MTDTTTLINYPCDFPIKVMGRNTSDFVATLTALVQGFDPSLDVSAIEQRPSRNGQYLGLTFIIHAVSRQQLDDLYQALSAHPMVSVVL